MTRRNRTAATGQRRIENLEQARQVFELRKAGLTYGEIEQQFGIPISTAHGMVKREMKRRREDLENLVEDYRALELERIDRLWRPLWRFITNAGNAVERRHLEAIDRMVRLSQRRAALLGLDKEPDGATPPILLNPPEIHVHFEDGGED